MIDAMWEVIYKNQIPWTELESLQKSLVVEVKKNPKIRYLLLSEPLPTFTYGRNSDSRDLLWQETELKQMGVQLAPVSRGGKWTYHGPGQIVCYPIAALANLGFSQKEAKAFVNQLRASVLELFWSWKLPAKGQDDPYGIFIEKKKLASFGMSFEEGIYQHGE
jgi:lipoate-protein ligase B